MQKGHHPEPLHFEEEEVLEVQEYCQSVKVVFEEI